VTPDAVIEGYDGIAGSGARAICYACREPLAIADTMGVRIVPGLVLRPRAKDGMARYGPARRRGHADARHARPTLGDGDPGRQIGRTPIYLNCPACDRSQVVRWE